MAQMFKSKVGTELWIPGLCRHQSQVTEKCLHSGVKAGFLTPLLNIFALEDSLLSSCLAGILFGGGSQSQCTSAEPIYVTPVRSCTQTTGKMAAEIPGGNSQQNAQGPAALILTPRQGRRIILWATWGYEVYFHLLGRSSSTKWLQSGDALDKRVHAAGLAAQH